MDKKLLQILLEAGQIALQEQKQMTVNTKTDKSIVTNGDLAVSQFLEKELKKIYPDHDIFSEENTSIIPQSPKVIVIDPIDGTESYSRTQDSWSILVGFLYNNEIYSGVVYQPSKNLLYYATKGKGAFKIDQDGVTTKLNAINRSEPLGISSPKDYGEKAFMENLGFNKQEYSYSAALKIMQVAEGLADIYANFRHKCSLWDLIAPVAILSEAGGQIKYDKSIAYDFNKTHIDANFCCFGQTVDPKQVF
jgi:3'(2'), 5'-bisphosphate nucleotidase